MQIPGHSKGFEPLAWGPNPAVKFCDALPGVNQLYDDPEGVTYKTLHALMGEMAALFTDECAPPPPAPAAFSSPCGWLRNELQTQTP